jgi:hypothetical protein
MTPNLTVTTALPPRGCEEAVLRVAARYAPSTLRIVASIPVPDYRQPLALHRFLARRDTELQRLDQAASLARPLVGPDATIETELVRGRLADHLASGLDGASVLVVPLKPSARPPVGQARTRDGRLVIAVAEPQGVMT